MIINPRTLNWLRTRYSASTKGFPLGSGMDSLGYPDQAVSDVYILFVMSLFDSYQIDYHGRVQSVVEMFNSINISSDSYRLSFLGMLKLNLNQREEALRLTSKLIRNQQHSSGEFANSKTSITSSRGKSLVLETTAISVIFLMRVADAKFAQNIAKGVDFIISNMQNGYFGSTQATVLCLKAVVEYSLYRASRHKGQNSFDVSLQNIRKHYTIDFENTSSKGGFPKQDWDLSSLDLSGDLTPQFKPNFEIDESDKFIFAFSYK